MSAEMVECEVDCCECEVPKDKDVVVYVDCGSTAMLGLTLAEDQGVYEK